MEERERETYGQFIDAIKNGSSARIPNKTLLGAITHYLSTLPLNQLPELIDTLLGVDSAGAGSDSNGLREACYLSYASQLQRLEEQYAGAWLSQRRISQQISRWFDAVSRSLTKALPSARRTDFMLGLLKSVKDPPLLANCMRRGPVRLLEDELIVALADLRDQGDLHVFTSSLGYIVNELDEPSLKALDTKAVLVTHRQALCRELSTKEDFDSIADHARIVARCFKCMDHDLPSIRSFAWTEINTALLDFESLIQDKSDDVSGGLWPSILTIGKCITTSLRHQAPPKTPIPFRSTYSAQILAMLSEFPTTAQESPKVSAGFLELLNECLDHMSAEGDTSAIHCLFVHLFLHGILPDRAAFTLVGARELLHHMAGNTVRDMILPLCHEYLLQPDHRLAFDASHAFLLALIQAAAKGEDNAMDQVNMLADLSQFYAGLILRQGQAGHLSSDQVVRTFSTICSAIAKTDPNALQNYIELLNRASQTATAPFDQIVRLCRIAICPALPSTILEKHLDDVAIMVFELDSTSAQRSELVEAIFGMVTRDLPDTTKRQGIQWWMRQSPAFLDATATTSPLSRL